MLNLLEYAFRRLRQLRIDPALVGLAAGLLSQSLIPAGYLCSAAASLPAYLLTGVFHCIVLWATGHAAWTAGLSVTLRELCVSLPWSLPMAWCSGRSTAVSTLMIERGIP